jgi:hypothetical protein
MVLAAAALALSLVGIAGGALGSRRRPQSTGVAIMLSAVELLAAAALFAFITALPYGN